MTASKNLPFSNESLLVFTPRVPRCASGALKALLRVCGIDGMLVLAAGSSVTAMAFYVFSIIAGA